MRSRQSTSSSGRAQRVRPSWASRQRSYESVLDGQAYLLRTLFPPRSSWLRGAWTQISQGRSREQRYQNERSALRQYLASPAGVGAVLTTIPIVGRLEADSVSRSA